MRNIVFIASENFKNMKVKLKVKLKMKLKLKLIPLSPRWVFAGRCISICLGCILGMWPLLLLSGNSQEKEDSTEGD
jgi:hypothetical protein